jgi:hypothetical protein
MILNVLGASKRSVKLANHDIVVHLNTLVQITVEESDFIKSLCRPSDWKTGKIHFDEKTICEIFEKVDGNEKCVLLPFMSENAIIFNTSELIAKQFSSATPENIFESISERLKMLEFFNYQKSFLKNICIEKKISVFLKINNLLRKSSKKQSSAPWFQNTSTATSSSTANYHDGKCDDNDGDDVEMKSPEYDPNSKLLDPYVSPTYFGILSPNYQISSPSYYCP